MPFHASLLFSRNLTAFVSGVHEGQGVRARFQRRHPAGRRHHARRRGEARAHARSARKIGDLEAEWISGRPLFVFVLASFIGLGVIRRVSRLLHTPLMSLTNAISAIAVVGRDSRDRRRLPAADPHSRRHRALRLDDQHRQRLPHHRSHAEDVQDARQDGAKAGGGPLVIGPHRPARLPRRVGAVHLRAALDEHARHGAQGRLRRHRGDRRSPILATWAEPAIVHHLWIVLAHRRRRSPSACRCRACR